MLVSNSQSPDGNSLCTQRDLLMALDKQQHGLLSPGLLKCAMTHSRYPFSVKNFSLIVASI